MKKTLMLFAMLLSAIAVSAKDVKTVVFTTNPIMHCENCENKIKKNLRYEKGVKEIQTNVSEQRVTVSYDADKTDAQKLQKAFAKFGYTATVVGGNDDCCKQNGKNAKAGSCCKSDGKVPEKAGSCCGGK